MGSYYTWIESLVGRGRYELVTKSWMPMGGKLTCFSSLSLHLLQTRNSFQSRIRFVAQCFELAVKIWRVCFCNENNYQSMNITCSMNATAISKFSVRRENFHKLVNWSNHCVMALLLVYYMLIQHTVYEICMAWDDVMLSM